MGKKRERLTKDINNIEQLTLEEIFLNSCFYDEINNRRLTFKHITQNEYAYQLLYDMFNSYKDVSIVFPENLTEDDDNFMREILMEHSIKNLLDIDGLLCNFFFLIESNAKLRERLKEYEDKEFSEESYYNKGE